jgi:hypothetical protein
MTQASLAYADPRECREASDQLRSVQYDLGARLQGYGDCVENNDGRDECDRQFSRLQDSQNEFQSAISDYKNDCP